VLRLDRQRRREHGNQARIDAGEVDSTIPDAVEDHLERAGPER
jgi:hypothetical protein